MNEQKLANERLRKLLIKVGKQAKRINELEAEIARRIADRGSEHYGPYGTACARTGQFDAGICWKCQIREMEEDIQRLRKGEQAADAEISRLREETAILSWVSSSQYRKARSLWEQYGRKS